MNRKIRSAQCPQKGEQKHAQLLAVLRQLNLLIKTSILIGLYYLQIALLKRAVEKFKSQLGADSASILSENSPKNSLTYHRITPISPSYQATSEGQKGKDLLYKWTEHLKNCLAHIETFNITRTQKSIEKYSVQSFSLGYQTKSNKQKN